jgi:hypothetical protein
MFGVFCDPAGTRTQGPYIKSVLLYQLSYGINPLSFKSVSRYLNGVQKYRLESSAPKKKQNNSRFFLMPLQQKEL